MLTSEHDASCRIIQHQWRHVLFERSLANHSISIEAKMRTRALYRLKLVELKDQWRQLRVALNHNSIPEEHVASYLRIVQLLTSQTTGYNPKADRVRVIQTGGTVILARYCVYPGRIGHLAKEIIMSLCLEVKYTPTILKSNVIEIFIQPLQHALEQKDVAGLKAILDVYLAVVCGCVEVKESSLTSGDDFLTIQYHRKTLPQVILQYLALPELFNTLFECLSIADVEVRIKSFQVRHEG